MVGSVFKGVSEGIFRWYCTGSHDLESNPGLLYSLHKIRYFFGIVTPINWDDDDNVIAVSISTPEEEEYFIKESPLAEELCELIHQCIRVTGVIKEDEYGEKSIYLEDYDLVEEGDEF